MPLNLEPFRTLSSAPPLGPARSRGGNALVIALINNMPETALEATEKQFSRLLDAASGSNVVRLRLASLPEVPRGNAGLARLEGGLYWPIDELMKEPLDALIVTGTEPCATRLSDEPYWERFKALLCWANANTKSSVWSCLAAHAAVELLDGIQRRRLEHKRCGVFSHEIRSDEALVRGLEAPLRMPHSRWNDLPVESLWRAGYTLVSSSLDNGADLFTLQRDSLLVFFQGHPEYEETTLLKEYRRDIGRFLRGQQSHYPTLPHDYFSPAALKLLDAFQLRAQAAPSIELLAQFPAAAVGAGLANTWRRGATQIYRNWLALLGPPETAVTVPTNDVSKFRV